MLEKLNPRRSPATVVAIAALIAALGGTAIAAGGFTAKQKKQVKKIATKVFDSNISGASVAHAGSADTASKASTANKADSATKANTATKSGEAEKLGGLGAAAFQRKIKGACPPPESLAVIGNEGEVTCTTPVRAIRMTPASGENQALNLGDELQLLTVCHDGGQVQMAFQNVGSTAGTLNWFYGNSEGAHANGASLPGGGESTFSFLSPGPTRIEGQFIYALPGAVMTVNLHAFDAGGFCEVRGTIEAANG